MDWWRVGGWWRRKLWKLSVDTYKSLTSLVILSQSKLEYSCTDGDVYLLSASSTETCDTLYSSNKEEIEVASAVQPYEGEPRASIANEDVDGVWQSRFLACGVQVKIRTKKLPLLNVCECCVCVMFSMAKSMFRIGSCTRVCCHNILILSRQVRQRFPLVSALEFRCCGVIPWQTKSLLLTKEWAVSAVIEPVNGKRVTF